MSEKTFKLDGEIANFDYRSQLFGNFISPREVGAFLDSLMAGESATIEINSCGGSCISGLAMANMIKQSKARITAHVIGIAASMASVVACACDDIKIDEGAFIMIHDPWSDMAGTAEELRKQADILDQMKAACISFYSSKFSCEPEKLAEMMSAETWMSGNDALSAGLACEVIKSDIRLAACATRMTNVPDAARCFIRDDICDELRAQLAEIAQSRLDVERAEADIESTVKARLSAAMKSRDTEINALKESLKEFEIKREKEIEQSNHELDEAKAETTSVHAELDAAKQECAEVRAQLAELQQAHARLMGDVLTPKCGESYAERMASARTPEERKHLRELKLAGKIN